MQYWFISRLVSRGEALVNQANRNKTFYDQRLWVIRSVGWSRVRHEWNGNGAFVEVGWGELKGWGFGSRLNGSQQKCKIQIWEISTRVAPAQHLSIIGTSLAHHWHSTQVSPALHLHLHLHSTRAVKAGSVPQYNTSAILLQPSCALVH